MIIIRPNKPLPLLSANQHIPFAFLSSCKGNIASSMQAKRIRQPKHSLTKIARLSCPGHGRLDTTPKVTFWIGPATLELPPSFCFFSPITHPNQVMPSFQLPLGRGGGGVTFPEAFGSSVMSRLFLCVYISQLVFIPWCSMWAQFSIVYFWFCWRFWSLMFPLPQAPTPITCISTTS